MCSVNKNKLGIGIIILCFLLITCKKGDNGSVNNQSQGNKSSLNAVVLFAVGDVRVGDRKVKTGDIISENESVITGKKSTCDVQIKESDAGIVIRLKASSMFELKMTNMDGKLVPSTIVNIGNAMVNVSGKLKNDENFQVVTPTQTAGVRGTKFEVNVTEDGSTTVSVSEGKVATRIRISEVDALPIEIQEKSRVISSIKTSLGSEEQIIEAGYKNEVTKAQTNGILKSSGLEKSIDLVNIDTQARLSPEQVQNAVNSIDATTPQDKDKTKSLKEVSNQKVEKISPKELQSKLDEFAELIAVEKNKLESVDSSSVVIVERNQKNEAALIKRMEEITGKPVQTINLKSGKKLKGIVFQEGDNYYILTLSGKETYKSSDIEDIEL
ncbi:MAG: FecR domain-containing protein [Leptospiraceae bacterium]|nr:FecR domain-containing protein [Leptospiraceae bacterium]